MKPDTPVKLAPRTLCVYNGETIRVVGRHGQSGIIIFRHEETGDEIALTDGQIRIAHGARAFSVWPHQAPREIEPTEEGIDRQNPKLEQIDDRELANVKKYLPYMEAWHRLEKGELVVRGERQSPSTKKVDRIGAAQAIAKKLGHDKAPSYQTLCSYYTKWRVNHDPRTLRSRHQDKGNRSSRLKDDVKEIADSVIREMYLVPQPTSVAELTREIARRVTVHYAARGVPEDAAAAFAPSPPTVSKLVKTVPARVRDKVHFGSRQAERDHDIYSIRSRPNFPLEVIQSDHSGLPAYLIDDIFCFPLGTVNITATFDVYSTCVLSAVIYFDDPNFDTIAESLRWTLTPKDALGEKLGISLSNTWNQYGHPRELVVDRGRDYISDHLDECCFQLGIQLTPVAGKAPYEKGHIERFFRTLKTYLRETFPGTRAWNLVKELGLADTVDPKKTAILTLTELQQVVTRWIVDIYHQQGHPYIPKSRQQVWDEGVAHGTRLPPDPALVKVATGRTIFRTLQHYGIDFNRLTYQSPELAKIRAYHERGKPEKVKVTYYSNDCTRVDVHDPRTGEAIPAFANFQRVLEGMSHWQWDVLRARLNKQRAENIDEAEITRAKHEIREIVSKNMGKRNTRQRRKMAAFNESGKSALLPDRSSAETEELKLPPPAPRSNAQAIGDGLAPNIGPETSHEGEKDDDDDDDWGSGYQHPRF